VVVAARNEEKNLPNCLQALLSQKYPKELTQIVVVDDRSSDKTPEILNHFKYKNTNLDFIRISKTPENVSPKKYALSQGIAKASGQLIFTTDADCTPPPDWISETVPGFKEEVGLVIWLAPMNGSSNLLGRLLCLDSLAAAFVSAGAAGWNVGVTCTGRNLAYRKTLFDEINGFENINQSLSGDDDLFLQRAQKNTQWRIHYSLNPRTAVPSSAPENLAAFFSQRRRHTSAGKYYARSLQAAYLLFNLANIYLFGFLIFSILNPLHLLLAILLFTLKLGVDFVSLLLISRKIRKQNLLILLPLWEIFYLLVQILIAPVAFIGKIKWK
jgi:cellulose synthase/poly-beta-1,6-N-acetylglucosamine synthase-like glycosyltransferase